MSLLLLTTVLGVLSILIIRVIAKRWFTPATWYWIAWFVAIACADLSYEYDLLPSIGPVASRLILQSHIGAWVGFVFATLAVVLVSQKKHQNLTFVGDRVQLPSRLVKQLTVFYLLLGTLHLAYRIALLGSVSASFIYDVRTSYLSDPYGLTRVATIAFTPTLFLVSLLAAEDRQIATVRMRRFLLLYLAMATHGFAMGGRIWLVLPLASYLFSYLLLLGAKSADRALLKRLAESFLPIIIFALLGFIILGAFRTVGLGGELALPDPTEMHVQGSGFMAPVVYAGVPLAALDLTSQYAAQEGPLYGQLLFPWFAQQLSAIGAIDFVGQAEVMHRELIVMIDYRIASTQCTALCLVAGDFGLNSIAWVMGLLMAGSQFLALQWAGKGNFRHAVATTCVIAAAFTVQDGWFGIAENGVGLLAILILTWRLGKNQAKRYRAKASPVLGRQDHGSLSDLAG